MRYGRLIVAAIAAILLPQMVLAQPRNMDSEQLAWRELQEIAPDQLANFKAATEAMDSGDHWRAIELFEKVRTKAPQWDVVLRRLGGEMAEAGHQKEGIALIEMAMQQKEWADNYMALARAYAMHRGEFLTGKLWEACSYARRAAELYKVGKGGDSSYVVFYAILSVLTKRRDELARAIEWMAAESPDDPAVHYFAGRLALLEGDRAKAEAEMYQFHHFGLPVDNSWQAIVERANANKEETIWTYRFCALCLLGVWIGGLISLFLLGKLLSGLTLKWIDQCDPNALQGSGRAPLRRYYRWLIHLAGLYYFISIPVVASLVLGAAGLLIYGFVGLSLLPVGLMAVIIVGALVTAFSAIRSVFVDIRHEDPGRRLRVMEAPGLWGLAREVAATVGTRAVDEIRITPGTDLAVYQRPSTPQRTGENDRRVLVLGIGMLNDFEQDAFRAVLAHEYGHFSHGDTAGGDVAIQVNGSLVNFAVALAGNGQAVWYNPAFLFLQIYHFIFRRVSHGAMRLQEVMADRVAARNYTPEAFEKGLKHVIRRKIEFHDTASNEIDSARREGRPLRNLYDLPVINESRIDREFRAELARQTSEDDTHPAPSERFRFVHRITFNGPSPANGIVWDLFANRAGITAEMCTLIERQIRTGS